MTGENPDLEAKFWEAVAKTEPTIMVEAVMLPGDDQWHTMVMTGSRVYLDGTVLPSRGGYAVWDRVLSDDEVRGLAEALDSHDDSQGR